MAKYAPRLNNLPEDVAEFMAQIYLHPKYQEILPNLDLVSEYKKMLRELKKLISQDKITQITQELEKLEGKNQLTAEEEAKQMALLAEVVKLRR